jgi:pimeloyl-ACP methyl ester carboxylesterase
MTMRKGLTRIGIGLVAAVAVALALLWTPDTDPAAMRARYGAPPSQFVDLGGGLTVHLRDEGPRDAPAILLLHGSNADLHTWEPWARDLAKDHRVIRFDQIGHGLTGPAPDRAYAPAAFVATVERVADRLALDRFIIGGSSMGGGVAWRYAAQHGDRVRGLILTAASGAPMPDHRSLPLGFRIAQTPVLRDAMLHLTPRFVIERTLQHSFADPARVTDAMVDRYWALLRHPRNRQATLDRFTTPRPPVDEARLRTIAVPTLILWGAEDRVLPPSGATWFGTRIAGARTIVYPRVGHLPHEEASARTLSDVRAWLAQRPPLP